MHPQKIPLISLIFTEAIRANHGQSVGDFIPINYELCIKETRQLHRVYFHWSNRRVSTNYALCIMHYELNKYVLQDEQHCQDVHRWGELLEFTAANIDDDV
mgnify:CR=1 FL=1